MADREGEAPAQTMSEIGQVVVAPYEANLIAQAGQKRLEAVQPARMDLLGLRSAINHLDHVIAHEAHELTAAWAKVRDNDSRSYEPEFPSRIYWRIMLLLVAVEIPLNAAALDFARLAVWETYVVAAGFGLLNFFGAKTVARVIRQSSLAAHSWRNWFVATAISVTLVTALVQFADLRRLDPKLGGSAGAFLALQLTFFVVSAAVSYFHFDPDPAREQLHRMIARSRVAMNHLWKDRAKSAQEYNSRLAEAQNILEDAMQDLQERIAQYRDANFLHRTDKAPDFMLRSVPASVFPPIDLGEPIDPKPKGIDDVVTASWEREQDQ